MIVTKCDFCIGNADNGSDRIRTFLEENYPNIQLRNWSCLGNCSGCIRRPFVIVNDAKILQASTPGELQEQLVKLVEEPADA
ncbi:MAG: hypothetical protein JWN30_702 [Bacilli bacterium]|nr:hypothetical protein [Bacilli bacterium]